jgi:hypothetical protein
MISLLKSCFGGQSENEIFCHAWRYCNVVRSFQSIFDRAMARVQPQQLQSSLQHCKKAPQRTNARVRQPAITRKVDFQSYVQKDNALEAPNIIFIENTMSFCYRYTFSPHGFSSFVSY